MAGHIVWGEIEVDHSSSRSKSQDATTTTPNTGTNTNNEKLSKLNINAEDVTQLSSDKSSSGPAAKVATEEGRRPGDVSDGDSSDGSDIERERQQQIEEQRAHMESLQNVDVEALKRSIPLDGDGQLTSIGSVGHAAGTCKVCLFAHSKAGCTNGMYCSFCHFYHKRPKRKNKLRPSKGKRDRYRKLVHHLTGQIKSQPETFDMNTVELPPSIAANESMRAKLFAKLAPFMEQARKDGNQASASVSPGKQIVSL
mmetsp:Transcript_117804/g.333975  ORF Transcript_117804/g.333975 Transcript_117804/m.333975 type:complete len:254 (-) Transcript_117804:194-955(-)